MYSIVQFPGIERVVGANYTLNHGISAGVCQLDCTPQDGLPKLIGPLTFISDSVSFTFKDCRIVTGYSRRTTNGIIWSFQIQDRRWKWVYGSIYGEYNRRDASGNLLVPEEDRPIIGVKKSAQELCKLLLDAMGETGYDVSQVTNLLYPHCEWIAANPAQELAGLADLLGLRVVLKINGKVALLKPGEGKKLPDGPVNEESLVLDPPEGPDSIEVIGPPVRVQTRLSLEAVGEDTDGTIKPINDLSYKPSGGWSHGWPFFDAVTDNSDRAKAIKTIFKLYRCRSLISVRPPLLPQTGQVADLQQILPISEELCEVRYNPETKQNEHKRGSIYGIYCINTLNNPMGNSTKDIDYQFKGGWNLDGERGLVIFDEPMFQYSTVDNGLAEAELYLECSFNIHTLETGQLLTWNHIVQSNGPKTGTGAEVLFSDTLRYEIYERFKQDGTPRDWEAVRGNAFLEAESEYLAANAFAKYETQTPEDVTYAGFVPVELDGAICSVTWSLEPQPMTHACRVTETERRTPQYGTRRYYEMVNALLKKQGVGPTSQNSTVKDAKAAANRGVFGQGGGL